MPDHVHSQPRKPKPDSKPAPPEKAAQFPVVRLQSMIGNQATQRLLQREGWSFNPVKPDIGLDPNSPNNLVNINNQRRERIRAFLDGQTASLRQSPKKLLDIVGIVRQGVRDADQFSTEDVQRIISDWAKSANVAIQQPNSATATPEEAAAAAASGLSIGVSPKVSKDDKGEVKIALGGSLEGIKKVLNLQFEVGEEVEIGFDLKIGDDMKLGAKTSKDSWEISFEYGEVDIPPPAAISEMFHTVEHARNEGISAAVKAALTPGARPPQGEVEAKVETSLGEKVKKIAQSASAAKEGKEAKGSGFKFKLTIKGPTPLAHDENEPQKLPQPTTVNLVVPF
jgi:hypothetical protein